MTDSITRAEVLEAQALATDAPGPACDAVRSLAATLLEFVSMTKQAHRILAEDGPHASLGRCDCDLAQRVRKFEGGE